MKYTRVLLNFSGEFFPSRVDSMVEVLKTGIQEGRKIAVVCGGGNILRGGRDNAKIMERSIADQIGMTSTIINSLFLYDGCIRNKIRSKIFTALTMQNIDSYNPITCAEKMDKKVVIIGGGTGQGNISTDTTSILRATELECDVWVKVTRYDAVYNKDPKQHPNAEKLENAKYADLVSRKLGLVDLPAAALGMQKNTPPMILIDGTNMGNFWEQIESSETIS